MKLLAIDTATEACSAALAINGEIHELYEFAANRHSKLILPMVDRLMSEAGLKPNDLDALAFGCGPGSFTGIRIATGVIQGIAYALDLPVVPVSNLASLAQGFFDNNSEDIAFVAADARMDEIYWGVYQRNSKGFAELISQETVTPPEQIEFPELTGVGIGTGWLKHSEMLLMRLEQRIIRYENHNLPRASAIAKLGLKGFKQGHTVLAEHALPVYLRDKVAKKENERN
ncbi:MAG: tRNA (adenosine(37)-N6)-threonylcarbamoyltransferase complex dimerization subunit type 1 TsaB [Gammaproteobacteria bacterium]|nr:tRNA (adenosine(37)-N6)-threonylcarbamoyltransferase complex dimerization subunit type 1 TsaB [Gammaproteobacteria bacterium]